MRKQEKLSCPLPNKMSLDFAAPLAYLITDGELTPNNLVEKLPETLDLIKFAIESKVSLIQIREKNLTAKQVFLLTLQAVNLTKKTNTKILVNDRADIALAAHADGVHLTTKSLSATLIRANFNKHFIIGVSAHNELEIENSIIGNADFATFSPIFPTISKEKYGAPQGFEKLRQMCEKYQPFPLIALGGINAENFNNCLKAGAKGIAAIKLFQNAEDLPKIVREIKNGKP